MIEKLTREQIEAIRARHKRCSGFNEADEPCGIVVALCDMALKTEELEKQLRELEREKRDIAQDLIERLRRPMIVPSVLLCREAADHIEELERALLEAYERAAKVCDLAEQRWHSGIDENLLAECAAAIRALSGHAHAQTAEPKDRGDV